MTLATDLAKRILETRYADLPPEAIHWAKVGLLDTVGCMIAGSRDKSTQIVTRVTTGSSGASLLFGQDRRAASNTPTASIPKAMSMRASACNMWRRARSPTAVCSTNILKTAPTTNRASSRC